MVTPTSAFDPSVYKELEGKELPVAIGIGSTSPVFEPITTMEIRRNAYSVADYNPLFSDPEYAKNTRYGGVIAAPYYPYMIDDTVSACIPLRIPGTTIVYTGTDWSWFAPIRPGDVITTRRKFLRADAHHSSYSGNIAFLFGETTYTNQRDEVVAVGVSNNAQYMLEEARQRNKYDDESGGADFPVFPLELKEKIQRDKRAQEVRGATPRYFEDVKVGDSICPVVQGPLLNPEVGFFILNKRFGPEDYVRAYPRDPANIPLEFIGEQADPWTSGRYGPGVAYANRAMPRGFDYGYQRMSWLIRSASSWIGDGADLKTLSGRLRRPYLEGDVVWYGGEVVDKRVEGGEHLVQCELRGKTQDDLLVIDGGFVAALPSRHP